MRRQNGKIAKSSAKIKMLSKKLLNALQQSENIANLKKKKSESWEKASCKY